MLDFIASLLPVFGLIVLGAVLRRLNFPGDAFWVPLEKLTYFVLFPALLFHAIAGADFAGAPIGRLGLILAAAMVLIAVILVAAKPALRTSGPAFTSIFQGAVRWNSFVALAAISALYGKEGLTLAAVAIAVMVPIANVLSVLALTRYAAAGSPSWSLIGGQLLRNPLLQACAAGIAVQMLSVPVPEPVLVAADMLGKASLALGLLAVGSSLDLAVARLEAANVAIASVLKLLVSPVIVTLLAMPLGLGGTAFGCALICASVPGAASSYILAKQLGGDAPLMAGITTVQTLAAMLTMPLVLWLFL
ncbi:MAG TPA: hypothetical protein DCL54_12905 [Alphaproteobacteria bacterium]|nr:hypothetical protein [Alphaproteobacteria bacterium]HAJ47469.1 hypothetical protein [Alphaproteobacteria bacterium]